MKHFLKVFLLGMIAATLVAPAAPAQTTLNDVLSKMDTAAAGFRTVVAELTYTKVTVIVDDKSVEKGSVYFQREPGKKTFKSYIHFREPSEKIVLFRDNKGWIYRPAIKQVEEYDLGKNREAVEQFLLLGFGTPGHDLQKAYDIKLIGEEKVGNQGVVKLELTPKSAATARHIKKVELWISKGTWQPVQQKFYEPSNDYLIATYGAPKLNVTIADSQFKLNLPKGVKTVKPQAG